MPKMTFPLLRSNIWVQARRISTKPLKVAFFGSDKFSVYSLDKLYQYQKENKSIDINVIARSIKPTGRNLKKYVDLPIGEYCSQNSIPIHRADSSKDILELDKAIDFNLAIAVSYGKLIPEQFLKSCDYGGLNVHPSLLPKYSGSSPIQYALMNDDIFTGVTIQTLHPTKFDHGDIILQSPEIPIQENDDFCLLRDKLGAIGGDLLIAVLAKELYLHYPKKQTKYLYSLAPKISPQLSQIDWYKHTPREIKRLADALGPLHTYKFVDIKKKKLNIKENQKVLMSDIQIEQASVDLNNPGDFKLENGRLYIKANGGCISVGSLKFQCCGEENPTEFTRFLKKRSGDTPNTFIFSNSK